VRNPDYYHKGLPYLDGFTGIYAPKQATQLDAIRADRAAAEFRGYPPSAIDQLKSELGDKVETQESDWNCGALVWFNHQKKPFDDVRVRRALTLALDRWGSAPGLSKDAVVHTVGSIIFPGSPLAPTKEELQQIAGFGPDIEKSRAKARRLLKEAGQENLSLELLNRNVDQPYKYNGTWLVDQWSKIGVKVTQKVVPTGPWFATLRSGDFDVGLAGNCQSIVNRSSMCTPTCRARSTRPITAITRMPRSSNCTKRRCTRPIRKAARSDVPVRQTRHGRRGACRVLDVVVSDRAVPVLHARLEDRIEPLPEPGSVDDLARLAALRRLQRSAAGRPQAGGRGTEIAAAATAFGTRR